MNVLNRLHQIADANADEPAAVSVDGEFTFDELYAEADRYAAALTELGVAAGDRFVLLAGNSVRTLAVLLAGWQVGAVPSPINVRLGDSTVEFLIDDADAEVVVVDDALDDLATLVEGTDGVSAVRSGEGGAFEARRLAGDVDRDPRVAPRLDDRTALMLHTSGTTGRPKWVRLTHGNLAGSAGVMVGRRLDGSDRGLHYYPLYHSGGVDMTLSRLSIGATTVIGSGWDPEDALRLIEEHAVDGIDVVPQMGHELVHHDAVDDYDLSSLDYFLVGADTVSEELADEFRALGAQPVQAYGLTETMAVVAVTPLGDADAPLDSTGRVVEDVARVRVVDPDTGEEVEPGEVGEILITGDKLSPGYHDRPEREAEAYEDGWLHTDDLGTFDEEGYLYVTGRLDDLLIVGGENVYPTDVEETLERHPGVSQAVVVGVPDERKGDLPVANVILDDGADLGEEELKRWFIERDAAFKHPRRVRFVETLPTTPVGKLDRVALEREAREEHGE